jgi:FkbM family methyltransferase
MGSQSRTDPRLITAVFVAVALGTLVLRMWPPVLVFEEPLLFRQPLLSALEPWNGYLSVIGRGILVVAHLFGDAGPLLTRVGAASIVGVVAGYLASADWAIPSRPVRLIAALALPFIPTAYADAYVGPLNSQWWLAVLVLLIALAPAKRWHWPVIALAGLSGLAPCVALPLFRDRRSLVLALTTAVQLVLLLTTNERHDGDLRPVRAFFFLAVALVASMSLARLPIRTRLSFMYLGLAILALGAYATGWGDRYFTVAWIGVVVGVASQLPRVKLAVSNVVSRRVWLRRIVDRILSKARPRSRAWTMEAAIKRAGGTPVGSVIDVGASNGSWSRMARRTWPDARFLLIEAQPVHEAALRASGFDFVLAAAGDKPGQIHFDAADPWGGVASYGHTGKADITVPMTTIDAEVAQRTLPPPYLVKLDTHGFEREILAGAEHTLDGASLLVIEAYNFELKPGALRFHELVAFLEQRGFRCVDLADPMHRPKDGALWQLDLVFCRIERMALDDNSYL